MTKSNANGNNATIIHMSRQGKGGVGKSQLLGVILKKCTPSLRRGLAATHPVFADAALTDVDAELEQFNVHAWCTPMSSARTPWSDLLTRQRSEHPLGALQRADSQVPEGNGRLPSEQLSDRNGNADPGACLRTDSTRDNLGRATLLKGW
jgi:hypothetical protein